MSHWNRGAVPAQEGIVMARPAGFAGSDDNHDTGPAGDKKFLILILGIDRAGPTAVIDIRRSALAVVCLNSESDATSRSSARL